MRHKVRHSLSALFVCVLLLGGSATVKAGPFRVHFYYPDGVALPANAQVSVTAASPSQPALYSSMHVSGDLINVPAPTGDRSVVFTFTYNGATTKLNEPPGGLLGSAPATQVQILNVSIAAPRTVQTSFAFVCDCTAVCEAPRPRGLFRCRHR